MLNRSDCRMEIVETSEVMSRLGDCILALKMVPAHIISKDYQVRSFCDDRYSPCICNDKGLLEGNWVV